MQVFNIKETELDEILENNNLVLVDIWAEWCGPCKSLSPILDELQVKYQDKIQIVKVNADENSGLLARFAVRSIPTMLFFKNQELQQKLVGLKQLSELSGIVETLL